MKNQYFGDINDYRKYGLLRILAAGGKKRIAVCWMLTSDDNKGDGKFTAYLDHPKRWRQYDPELFDILSNVVGRKKERDVASLSRARLIPSATYFSRKLTDGNTDEYFDQFETELKQSDIIFFDPDNGLEIRSIPRGRRGSHKYLYWKEAARFFSLGHSLLVYQHYPRMGRERFIILKAGEIFSRINTTTVYSFRTAKVVFFFISQRRHVKSLRFIARKIRYAWGDEIIPEEHHIRK
ncbi:MAG: hypothetical protein WBZ48_09825 [Bacteroidota bacterium]